MKFTEQGYKALKFIALVLLPAGASAYAGIAAIWSLGDVTQIVGTISAVDTFLGVILHISSSTFAASTDGKLVVDKSDPAKDTYSLELDTSVDEIDKKKVVTFAVVPKG